MSDVIERLNSELSARYVVERELGSGGMATVFLANDLKHNRKVAIKVLRPDLAATLGADRFLNEIETAARLSHPHILPLHDSGEADGLLYYVMPYVEGESLRDRLSRERSIPVEEALEIVREIGSALSYAHSRGVVHRDIKPANVLFSGGHAVVADFGIAKAITASGGVGLTQAGIAVGTPTYMSPEQVVGSEDVDGRSDLYSLACVLYEMLSGDPPFDGPTAQAILAKRFSDPIPKLTDVPRRLPAKVEKTLTRAFAQEPADRFATVTEFVTALRAAPVSGEPIAQRIGVFGVVGLYLLASIVILGVARFLMVQLGLPDWVMPGVAVLLAVGLGAVALMALAERSVVRVPRWLTWRAVARSGAVGFGGWATVVVVYMAMRLLGIGPVGTLVASGILDREERIIIAEFQNRTGDTLLTTAISEALRIDLAESPVVTVVEPAYLSQVLVRMERSPDERLDGELAREVAVRDGIKAVLTGEVNVLGRGIVISARLVEANSGEILAAVRETSASTDDVIPALDRLSEKLRGRIGESLKTIRGSEPLEQVTTASLQALQRYSLALRAIDQGDPLRGRSLLQEAIALDSAFAMAYRKLGIVPLDRAQQVEVLTKAFEYRTRLTDRERYLTEGTYYSSVLNDSERAITAYRNALDIAPDDFTALNNLAGQYLAARDYVRAEEMFARGLELDSLSPTSYQNTMVAQVALGKTDEARTTLERFEERLPNHPMLPVLAATLATVEGDYQAAEAAARDLAAAAKGNAVARLNANSLLAGVALLQGRLAEAERRSADASADAEAIGVPGVSLSNALQFGFFDVWFREDPERGVRRVKDALARYPLENIEPLNRPYLGLAQFYAVAGRPDDARQVLGEFEAAIEPELRRAIEPSYHALLGLVALAEDRSSDAIREFRLADEGACSMCILPFLGMAYDQAGEVDSVLAIYERYLTTPWLGRINQDILSMAMVYERLGNLYAARGDRDRATDYYDSLIRLWEDADQQLQPRVAAARRAIVELSPDRPRR